jgi:hypothetical protein
MSPGWVDANHIREKISKQLLIDLDEQEKIYLSTQQISYDELLSQPPVVLVNDHVDDDDDDDSGKSTTAKVESNNDNGSDLDLQSTTTSNTTTATTITTTTTKSAVDHYISTLVTTSQPDDKSIQIKSLGEYVAVIGLRGNQYVPLRVDVRKR